MRRVLTALLVLVGLAPTTLHAAPVPTYASLDSATELARSYFGARYYASGNGRFTTVDPMLDSERALADPQRWHRYTYVRNNPFRFVDPDGRDHWRDGVGDASCAPDTDVVRSRRGKKFG